MVGWHHRLSGHEFEQTPGDSERQEQPGVLLSMESQRVGSNLATEQQQHEVLFHQHSFRFYTWATFFSPFKPSLSLPFFFPTLSAHHQKGNKCLCTVLLYPDNKQSNREWVFLQKTGCQVCFKIQQSSHPAVEKVL